MHIGIHCFEYPPCNHGGIGSFSKDLAEGLVHQGHDVTIFGFYFENVLDITEPVKETINGVRIIRYPRYLEFSNVRMNIFFSRIKLYRLIKELHKEKPFDVIESPENVGWIPFGTPNNIPLITRLHGGETYFGIELNRKSSRINKFLEKQQLKHSNHIVSVSDYTAKKTLDIFGLEREYSVIYNSVQVPEEFECSSIPIEENLIIFSGSVLPKKGVEELMHAMNIICQTHPTAKLAIAGKNIIKKNGMPYEEYLMELVEEPYRDQIIFMGAINREKELFPLLCKAHICCFPSHTEAFAIAPLEAMAFGKPVVYSILSSGKEALVHMESGLLCNPKEPENIAENVLLLLNDKALCEKLGSKAKTRVEELFNYNKWITSNVILFEKFALCTREEIK